ncbi:MAG: hypothetical protein EPO25_09685 [Gammaproteobacteria bacterium]|nr:MAG: hypothetical protein EPO25_09685 [Gammaproteobacteria bacterium]
MAFSHAPDHGQPEASTTTRIARREERLENALLQLRGNAGPGVLDGKAQIVTGRQLAGTGTIRGRQGDIVKPHGDATGAGHGVCGVADEVHHDLAQLGRIGQQLVMVTVADELQLDARRQAGAQQLQ